MKKFKFMTLALLIAAMGTSVYAYAPEDTETPAESPETPAEEPLYAVYNGVWYSYMQSSGAGTQADPYSVYVYGVADTDDGVTALTIPASFTKANQADQNQYFKVVGFDADWAQQGSDNVDGVEGDEDFAAVSVTLNTLTVNIDNFGPVSDESNPFATMTEGLKKLTSLTIIDGKKNANNTPAYTPYTVADLLLSSTVMKKLTTLNIGTTGVTLSAGSEFKKQETGEWAKLTSITLPSTLTEIGESTFENSAITAITIPGTVQLIGEKAFKKATAITSVTIPAATAAINPNAFEGCTGLTGVTFATYTTGANSGKSSLSFIGANAFKGCTGLTSIDLSKATVADEFTLNAAFTGCTGITAVTLNDKVKTLVANLFKDTKITEISALGAETVYNVMGATSSKKNTTLTKVTLGPVTYLAPQTFAYCTALTEASIDFDADKAAEQLAEVQAILETSEASYADEQQAVEEAEATVSEAQTALTDAQTELQTVIALNGQLTAAKAAVTAAETAITNLEVLEEEQTVAQWAESYVYNAEEDENDYTEYKTAYDDAVAAQQALLESIPEDYEVGEETGTIDMETYTQAVVNATVALTTAQTGLITAEAALETAKAEAAELAGNSESLLEGLIVTEKAFYYCTALKTFNYAPTNADAKYVNDNAFLGCSSNPLVLFVTSTVYQNEFTAPYQTTYGDEAATTVTTKADAGTSGKFFAKFHATSPVQIDPADAKVYSVYVDEGTAYFQALQKKSGMYVLLGGENIILKTDEEKEIEIAPYNGTATSSSVLVDDIICPQAATTLTALQEAGAIETGEYLYRLTNNAATGGFGFTYYTKDAISAGQFFIASTIAPAAGRLNIVWLDENGNVENEATAIETVKNVANDGEIFNLAGQKVDANYKGVVIKNGKKVILK